MRSIQVTTEVFAAIWAARETGEDTEDQVLQRLLRVQQLVTNAKFPEGQSGYTSKRYSFSVPEGFLIGRTFKGRDYEATATNGGWKLLGSNEIVSSLSKLSEIIGTGIENVWANWFYTDGVGKRRAVSDLRNPTTIKRRES